MKWSDWLENWNMTSLKIKTPFLEMDWNPSEPDKDAGWELYIELLTRIATQKLPDKDGDEKTALESIHSLFGITRTIIITSNESIMKINRKEPRIASRLAEGLLIDLQGSDYRLNELKPQ